MTLETQITNFSFDPILFAQRIMQTPVLGIKKDEHMTICSCMTHDLISLHNALPHPSNQNQASFNVEMMREKIFFILNKYLLGSGYQCQTLDRIHRVTIDFSKRQFSLVGPFTFQAKPILEEIDILFLMKALGGLHIGDCLTFSVKSTVLIFGFTEQEMCNFKDSEPVKSITIKLNQIVQSRFENLEKQGLNFFIGPPQLITGIKKTRTVEFSKEHCLLISSIDKLQGIRISLLAHKDFEKALSDQLETASLKQEITTGIP